MIKLMIKNSPHHGSYSSTKNISYKSLSPQYPVSAVLLSQQKQSQERLRKKLHKLKHSLHSSQKHNQQLHEKLRVLIDSYHQLESNMKHRQKESDGNKQFYISQIQKLEYIKKENEEQIKAYESKQKYGNRENNQKIKELDNLLKAAETKNASLETQNKDLEKQLSQMKNKIQLLENAIENMKLKNSQEGNHRLQKLEKQISQKINQNHETNRQVIKLKQSLRDSLKKLEKATATVAQHTSKNKQLQEDNKQLKKLIQIFQKESVSFTEISQKHKLELLSGLEKQNSLEKMNMQILHEKQNISEKLIELQDQYRTLYEVKQKILEEYNRLKEQYAININNSYEYQRDFERQLHTIVKELTRRHIVSKSMINNLGTTNSTICIQPQKSFQGKQIMQRNNDNDNELKHFSRETTNKKFQQ